MMFNSPLHILLFGIAATVFWSCSAKSELMGKTETEAERTAAYSSFPNALYPVRIKDKWGYMNRKGEIVIQPTYDAAEDFEDGLAVAMIIKENQTHYGYIDEKGSWTIVPAFDEVNPFYEDKAAVKKGELYGYIDKAGKEIIPCQFEQAGPFSEGRAAVKKNGWVGFINSTGTIVIEPIYTCSVSHPFFVNGLAPVFGADEMTGFIDPSGVWKIEPKFNSAGRFVDGKAWAMIQKDDAASEHGFTIKGGYINTDGEFVIQPQYDFGWDFSEGYAVVWKISADKKNKLWSVLDSTGNPVLHDLTYRNVGAMSSGLIPIQNDEMKWGFMNIKGEEVIPPQYTGINQFKNGLARMETGSAFSPQPVYINPKGEVVWKE
jgi:hypothetical protein